MGQRGPVPKRSSERRRQNKDSQPLKVTVAGPAAAMPPVDPEWHPIAQRTYESLAESGQSEFYEPSDWALAYLGAESMSRDLQPQFVGLAERTGEPVFASIPLKGASLAAYLKWSGLLGMTMGDRLRMGIELERGPVDEETPAGVTAIADYRSRLA